jgi:hypothetical protein
MIGAAGDPAAAPVEGKAINMADKSNAVAGMKRCIAYFGMMISPDSDNRDFILCFA